MGRRLRECLGLRLPRPAMSNWKMNNLDTMEMKEVYPNTLDSNVCILSTCANSSFRTNYGLLVKTWKVVRSETKLELRERKENAQKKGFENKGDWY